MIRSSRFAEYINVRNRDFDIDSNGDMRKTEGEPETLRAIASTPFFRGYVSERAQPSHADVRLSAAIVFFVTSKVEIVPVKDDDNIGDIIEYPVSKNGNPMEGTLRYLVTAVFKTGPRSHSEVFCNIEDNKQTTPAISV